MIFTIWEKLQILILAKSKNPYKSLKIKKLNTHEILIFLQNLVLPKLSENKIHFTSRAARDTDWYFEKEIEQQTWWISTAFINIVFELDQQESKEA